MQNWIFSKKHLLGLSAMLLLTFVALAACGDNKQSNTNDNSQLRGTIIIDGSSTVEPISTLVSFFFTDDHPDVQVPVGTSGTGGGFEKFCNGETEISDASRPIKDSEAEICTANGVEYLAFQVGIDAITVVVNPENSDVECLTTEQLATIFGANSEGTITNWSQVDSSFPDLELSIYAPDADSGTFDFFHEIITDDTVGGARTDYTPSTDDNVLVQGVRGSTGGIAYFGLAYYTENQDSLAAVAIDGGDGCVLPSFETALDGSYTPLSRPLFIYVRTDALERPEVEAFVAFYLRDDVLTELVAEAGYAAMSEALRQQARDDFAAAIGK